jgi:uncharacterized protein
MSRNIFTWVEIYVEDMNRARRFYETVLQVEMINMETPGEIADFQMVSFPWEEDGPNISGALVKTSSVKPGVGGTVAYFQCEDCAVEISRVENAGGKVHQEKFPIGDYGFCGICSDTEGNMIGFHSMQ